MKWFVSSFLGIMVGLGIGWYLLFFSPQTAIRLKNFFYPEKHIFTGPKKEIIGFLPYWFVGKVQSDYADTITTLTYFGLTVGEDGHLQLLANNDTEEEPGWHTLKSEKMQNILKNAKQKNITTSLLVFSGSNGAIDALISDPMQHARNLVSDVVPHMKKFGFTDLNLDIESTTITSEDQRQNFSKFVSEVKRLLDENHVGTLTVEITGNDLIKTDIINPKDMALLADYVVIMAYDFHYANSYVTGPVAPIGGADSEAEFDTNVVLSQAYKVIPKEKIILGIPSYGYSWETLQDTPRSAVLPGSGLTMSNEKSEQVLGACSSCSAIFDEKSAEQFVSYKDSQTGTIHQIYYPNEQAVQKKVDLVSSANIGGLAIWALGYESKTLYNPISTYKSSVVDITRL